jgi:hypothetical protein
MGKPPPIYDLGARTTRNSISTTDGHGWTRMNRNLKIESGKRKAESGKHKAQYQAAKKRKNKNHHRIKRKDGRGENSCRFHF